MRAAIVSPVRTPVGRFGGIFKDVPAEELASVAISSLVERSCVDPERIDDVVFAQSYANSEAPCIGRWAALNAGLPLAVPGMQLDRRCGGGLQAIVTAAMMVQTGAADVVIAGGVEAMSSIEYYSPSARWGARAGNTQLYDRLDRGRERSQPAWRFGHISGMIETAENLATKHGISREAADEYALQSHRRAAAAREAGSFAEEIAPVTVQGRGGSSTLVDLDESIRPDTSLQALAALRTVIPDGTVTAGNAAQQNDAAAACLVVAETMLDELGLEPIAYLDAWTAVGCEPKEMGWGPVPAVEKLLAKTGMTFDQFDLIELNEAFAVQVLAVARGWGLEDFERLNVNGSGISLGHPVGATGVRILTTMLYELRRRGGRYALESMCIGGGQGMAAIFEAA